MVALLERSVVACFLRFDGRICLLKRSQSVGSSPGRWHCVTGFLEDGIAPLDQALTEIVEETGLEAAAISLVGAPEPLRMERPGQGWVWVVYPFLFDTASSSLRLDWEHDEYRWIDPAELASSDCVPWIRDVWTALSAGRV
ncbi:MAG: NUDIX domain-containing protein [Chloroflexi bacterium]|nr:NUDIX domain-containing protein [Chloroflexota bacterium]